MKRLSWIALLVVLGACQVFNRPDTPATLRVQNANYVLEATSIQETAQAQGTKVRTTAAAAETIIVEGNSINLQLMLTARVLVAPSATRAGVVSGLSGGTPVPGGQQFVDTHIASFVREADGCAGDTQFQFSPDSPRIYATTRATTLNAGTQMSVEWFFQGARVWQESFTVSQDSSDFCMWFYIDPQTITFSPGGWSARLYANSVAIEPELTFTIADTAMAEG